MVCCSCKKNVVSSRLICLSCLKKISVLDLLKEKEVNIELLHKCNDVEVYNLYCCEKNYLSYDEFNEVKRYV